MHYFSNIRTQAEGETRYRELAKKLHPDAPGGNTQKFQEMKAEWEELKIYFKHQSRLQGVSPAASRPPKSQPKPKPAPKAKPAPKTPKAATTQKKRQSAPQSAPPPVQFQSPPPNTEKENTFNDILRAAQTAQRATTQFVSILEGVENLFRVFED